MFVIERHYLNTWSAKLSSVKSIQRILINPHENRRILCRKLLRHEEATATRRFLREGTSCRRALHGSRKAAQARDQVVPVFHCEHAHRFRKGILLNTSNQIGIPYIRSKLDDLYERLGGGVESDLFNDRPHADSRQIEAHVRLSALIDRPR